MSLAVQTLQLSVQAGLKIDAIGKLLSAASRLVGHFRHSSLTTHIWFSQNTTRIKNRTARASATCKNNME